MMPTRAHCGHPVLGRPCIAPAGHASVHYVSEAGRRTSEGLTRREGAQEAAEQGLEWQVCHLCMGMGTLPGARKLVCFVCQGKKGAYAEPEPETIKPLPCPSCGGVHRLRVTAGYEGYSIICDGCYDYAPDIGPGPHGTGKTAEAAIADWNEQIENPAHPEVR